MTGVQTCALPISDRKLHPHWARSVERRDFQLICDCKERQYEEAFVLRFVPAVWNPLVCERIVFSLIGQRFTAKWSNFAAYQPGCERYVVDRFYLFVPMIDRNYHCILPPILLLYVWSTAGSTNDMNNQYIMLTLILCTELEIYLSL